MIQNAQTKKEVKEVKTATPLKVVETPKTTENEEKAPLLVAKNESQLNEVENFLNPSAEFRLKKLEQFQVLAGKFQFLKTKEDELNKFILSSDGTKEKISLSNASGFKFEVSNSQTIEKVLKLIQEDLSLFIGKAETEVKAFII